jgi:hypothetical protein
MGTTSGARTAYPCGAPEFTPVFSGVRVTRTLVLGKDREVFTTSGISVVICDTDIP